MALYLVTQDPPALCVTLLYLYATVSQVIDIEELLVLQLW